MFSDCSGGRSALSDLTPADLNARGGRSALVVGVTPFSSFVIYDGNAEDGNQRVQNAHDEQRGTRKRNRGTGPSDEEHSAPNKRRPHAAPLMTDRLAAEHTPSNSVGADAAGVASSDPRGSAADPDQVDAPAVNLHEIDMHDVRCGTAALPLATPNPSDPRDEPTSPATRQISTDQAASFTTDGEHSFETDLGTDDDTEPVLVDEPLQSSARSVETRAVPSDPRDEPTSTETEAQDVASLSLSARPVGRGSTKATTATRFDQSDDSDSVRLAVRKKCESQIKELSAQRFRVANPMSVLMAATALTPSPARLFCLLRAMGSAASLGGCRAKEKCCLPFEFTRAKFLGNNECLHWLLFKQLVFEERVVDLRFGVGDIRDTRDDRLVLALNCFLQTTVDIKMEEKKELPHPAVLKTEVLFADMLHRCLDTPEGLNVFVGRGLSNLVGLVVKWSRVSQSENLGESEFRYFAKGRVLVGSSQEFDAVAIALTKYPTRGIFVLSGARHLAGLSGMKVQWQCEVDIRPKVRLFGHLVLCTKLQRPRTAQSAL